MVCLVVMLAACQTTSPPSIADVLERGGTVYQEEGCANCHGPEGTGEIGPDLSGVLDTFGSCDDQVEWVSLGSARWRQQRDSSYGDTNKPVRGGMPGFGERLEEDQIRRVVSFTRSEFAGGDEIDIVNDCFG